MLVAKLLENDERYKRRDFEHRQRIASLENEILYLERVEGSRKRKTFKRAHPREHGDRGRALVKCRACEKYGPQKAHGLCLKCYNAWHYAKFARHKRIGSKRLTYKELKQVTQRDNDGKRRFEDAQAVGSLRRKGYL